MATKTTVSFSVDHRLVAHLGEQAKRTGLTKTALVEHALKLLFASQEGNEWLELQAARRATSESLMGAALDG